MARLPAGVSGSKSAVYKYGKFSSFSRGIFWPINVRLLAEREFLAIHESESVADIVRPAGVSDAVHVVFRMFGHIVIDTVTYAGNIESARGKKCRSRNHGPNPHDALFRQ
jgi:hypothetical protein